MIGLMATLKKRELHCPNCGEDAHAIFSKESTLPCKFNLGKYSGRSINYICLKCGQRYKSEGNGIGK
jgi:DNA-directed RNA polymerase subunit RPC12/RpoP